MESHNTRDVDYLKSTNTVGYTDSDLSRYTQKFTRRGDHECWFWRGCTTTGGYGLLGMGPKCSVPRYAHRIAWELANGPIPSGLFVCHRCDQRNCVNPAHLFVGTATDNMRDASSKGRLSVSRPKGHRVTDAQCAVIVRRAARGESNAALARAFGVSAVWVGKVVKGQRRQYRVEA